MSIRRPQIRFVDVSLLELPSGAIPPSSDKFQIIPNQLWDVLTFPLIVMAMACWNTKPASQSRWHWLLATESSQILWRHFADGAPKSCELGSENRVSLNYSTKLRANPQFSDTPSLSKKKSEVSKPTFRPVGTAIALLAHWHLTMGNKNSCYMLWYHTKQGKDTIFIHGSWPRFGILQLDRFDYRKV